MAHFYSDIVRKPSHFNFAEDVVDYWASMDVSLQAMHWISPDTKTERKLSYAHFSRLSHRAAAMFEQLGARKGDRMIIILPRVPAWWEIVCGAIRMGIIICPCTTLLVDKDIEYRFRVSGANIFVGDDINVEKFMRIRDRVPACKTILQVGGLTSLPYLHYETCLEEIPKYYIFPSVRTMAEDGCMIYFTSGTTGLPKMVLHNQISYPLAHTITGKHWLRLQPGKIYWNLSEQGWAKAAWSFFGSWNCGATLFVHDDRNPFNASGMLDILHRFAITTLCAPPTVYRQLVTGPNQKLMAAAPPHALEHCVGAGEPLNGEVIRLWERMTKRHIVICDGYGQSETIMLCGNFADFPVRPGSMGKPSPGVTMRVLDEQGAESRCGVEGEIGISCEKKGNQDGFFGLFDGYLNAEAELKLPLRPGPDGRRWYLTGDRATVDEDGYFWFVGRNDDVINSAGYRIGPFEVESALKLHPGIVESAVVSSPDPDRVEVVKAFVVLTPDYARRIDVDTLTKEIQDFCKKNAAPYKYPRRVQFVDQEFLPKTISGKIKRGDLRKMEWQAYSGRL